MATDITQLAVGQRWTATTGLHAGYYVDVVLVEARGLVVRRSLDGRQLRCSLGDFARWVADNDARLTSIGGQP